MTRTLAIILALSVTPAHAQVLCPPPAFPTDKSDKGPPEKCLTQTEVEKDIQRAGRQGDGSAVKRGTR